MGGVSGVGTVFSGGRGGGDFARGTGKVAELRDEAPRQGGRTWREKGIRVMEVADCSRPAFPGCAYARMLKNVNAELRD